MALHGRSTRIALALFVLLSFAGGVIVLGGAAKATNLCHNDVEASLRGEVLAPDVALGLQIAGERHLQPFPRPIGKSPNAAYNCGIHLSLDWWIIAYQVFTIKLGLMGALFEKYHSKHIVMNVYTINIILVTFITSVYVKLAYNFSGAEGTGNEMGQAVKTVTAGVITILVANFSFLILFGTNEEQQPKVAPSKKILPSEKIEEEEQ